MVYDILWRDFRSRGNLPLILKKVQSSHISERTLDYFFSILEKESIL
jgi:hypothetical protein